MISSTSLTTTALPRIGLGFGSSFDLGISFLAFLLPTSHFVCQGILSPQDFAAAYTCLKTEVWGFGGSFSVVLSALCSPLLAVKAPAIPAKYH